MRSLIFFIIALSFFCHNVNAQCTDSLIGGGGPASDFTSSATMDSAENLYTTGYYDSLANFSDTTIIGSSLRYGAFLSKYNAKRGFEWVKRIARAKKGFPQPPVIAGSGKHLYIFGRTLNDTVAVNGVIYTSPGQPGIRLFFLLHADLNGAVTWQKTFRYRDMLSSSTGFAIVAAPDTSGSIYISGTFTDTIRIGTILLGTAGNVAPAIFIAKINNAGTVLWARQSSSTSTAYAYVNHMHLGPHGRIILGGHYHSSITFGSNTAGITPSAPVSGAPFLVAFDTAGTFGWLTVTTVPGAHQSLSLASASDAAGNIYTTGYINDTLDFGSGIKLAGINDMYLAKYSGTGTLIWAKKKSGHVGLSGIESGTGITLNHAGHLILTGVFTDSTYFGNSRYLSAGGQDFFIGEYDTGGSPIRINTYGSTGSDEAYCPIVHPDDSVVVSGIFSGPVLSMNGRMIMNNGLTGSDIFWYDRCAKIDSIGPVVGIRANQAGELKVYPNPASDEVRVAFAETSNGVAILSVYDITGHTLLVAVCPSGSNAARLSAAEWPGGTYLVSLKLNNKIYRKLVAKQ